CVGFTRGCVAQPTAAREHVERDGGLARDLGPSAVRTTPVVLELAEAILGVDEALPEERVVRGHRAHVRDPPLVAEDLDVGVETEDAYDVTHVPDAMRGGRATIVRMHERLIRSARRRLWIVTAIGVVVLTC